MAKDRVSIPKKELPNFPSDKPDVVPAQPQKTFNKWFLSIFQLNKTADDDMNMVVQWQLGRTYVEAGETKIEMSKQAQSFVFNDVLSDAFEEQNPEMSALLNELLSASEAICKRQGGLDANGG